VPATTTQEDEEIRPLDNRMRRPIRTARAPSATHRRLNRESARVVRRSRFRLRLDRREEIRMKLFVDTGNVKEVEALAALGILDGVTTNPTLLSKEAGDYREILKTLCQIVKGPVSGEVVATDYAGMLREGHDLARIDEHIIVKVPLTRDGIKACKTLANEAIRVNVTLVFSPAQALLAAKAGATFVSPFIGRLDDVASSGMSVVRDIVEIFGNYDFTTEVLVASCRHPMHIVEAARIGADICTSPAAVIDALFNHPLTNIGLERFIKDWETIHAVKA
jgi:transaldolase